MTPGPDQRVPLYAGMWRDRVDDPHAPIVRVEGPRSHVLLPSWACLSTLGAADGIAGVGQALTSPCPAAEAPPGREARRSVS